MPTMIKNDSIKIKNGWNDNLDSEFRFICELIIGKYTYIAMDTDFLGTVIRYVGNLPSCGTDKFFVWQFHFCEFNPNEEPYPHDYIEFLVQSGIDFKKNNEKGKLSGKNLLKVKDSNNLHGGLNKFADLLEVKRIGNSHQAGSDSLLSRCTFMDPLMARLKNMSFECY
ncbi:hypothetical protein ACFE04_013598 [Oxalis oulophora]